MRLADAPLAALQAKAVWLAALVGPPGGAARAGAHDALAGCEDRGGEKCER